jgi:hypothetical protein
MGYDIVEETKETAGKQKQLVKTTDEARTGEETAVHHYQLEHEQLE